MSIIISSEVKASATCNRSGHESGSDQAGGRVGMNWKSVSSTDGDWNCGGGHHESH